MKIDSLHSDSGFTLIETLLVIFIVFFIISFPILSFHQVQKDLEIELFLEELSSRLMLTQSHTILNGERAEVAIYPSFNRIDFSINGQASHPLDYQLHFPDSVSTRGGVRRIYYRAHSGNINDFSPLVFQTSKGRYEVKFQLGSGRFAIEGPE
jgi:competence protein ComGD